MWEEGWADMGSPVKVNEREEKERQHREEKAKPEKGINRKTDRKPIVLSGYMDWMSLQINQQTLRMWSWVMRDGYCPNPHSCPRGSGLVMLVRVALSSARLIL
jgi:hypothetical protein